jgi:large subunit ribosomal protein L25
MSTTQTISASPRTPSGKGDTRRLRAAGQVPAIAYGKGIAATALSVQPKEVITILKSEHGQNSLISMKLEGKGDFLAMIKAYSYHPVTRKLEHVDFVEVKLDVPVEVEVPFFTVGKAAGVAKGGILRQVFRLLPVSCLPNQIPLKIEVDVSHLELNEAAQTKDLKLPEGVKVMFAPELTLAAVVAPEKERAEDVAATGAAPGAAAAAPGAPAAAGKDAKAAPAAAAAPAKDAKKK